MIRKPSLMLAGFADNAMLYKDITQWLRNRTFVILFFGLLTIAEITTVLVVLVSRDEYASGHESGLGVVSFSVLSSVLFVYGLIIAFLGHNLTAREFFNRTFELYELSGMSLERMVWGKSLSMLVQFSFGFFCLVPFMFVAFMLGGLDFYLVVTVSLLIVLAIIPLYLLALFVALLSRSKQVGGLVRGIALVLLFLVIPWFGITSFMQFARFGSASGGPVDFVKLLVTLDIAALKQAGVFLAFYGQICLLIFYLCCNAISPSTDSRSTAIHVLALLLTVSYLGMMLSTVVAYSAVKETGYLYYVPVAIVYLIIGLTSLYGRLDVPIMTRKRQCTARIPGVKWMYSLFSPGVKGGFRTLLVFYAVFLGFWAAAKLLVPSLPTEFDEAAATALQMPFFLAFPGLLLIRSRSLAGSIAAMKTAVVMWWVVLGIPLMITVTMMDEWRSYNTVGLWIIRYLALLVSPLSSVFVEAGLFLPLRVALGIVGLVALLQFVRVRLATPKPAFVT